MPKDGPIYLYMNEAPLLILNLLTALSLQAKQQSGLLEKDNFSKHIPKINELSIYRKQTNCIYVFINKNNKEKTNKFLNNTSDATSMIVMHYIDQTRNVCTLKRKDPKSPWYLLDSSGLYVQCNLKILFKFYIERGDLNIIIPKSSVKGNDIPYISVSPDDFNYNISSHEEFDLWLGEECSTSFIKDIFTIVDEMDRYRNTKTKIRSPDPGSTADNNLQNGSTLAQAVSSFGAQSEDNLCKSPVRDPCESPELQDIQKISCSNDKENLNKLVSLPNNNLQNGSTLATSSVFT